MGIGVTSEFICPSLSSSDKSYSVAAVLMVVPLLLVELAQLGAHFVIAGQCMVLTGVE
jgi:hypothetical protein